MDERRSEPRSRSPDKPADDCLYSWKEIAAHFKCSERTVRRWEEMERLPVHRHPHKKKASIYAFRAELDAWWNDGRPRLEKQRQGQAASRRPGLLWLALAATAVIAGCALWFLFFRHPPPSALPSLKVVPLTSYAGMEYGPALSPDGAQVAFLWTGEMGGGMPDLYVKAINAPKPLRLTNTPDGYENSLTWSPDGRYISFVRTDESGDALYTIPALGGMEKKLAKLNVGGLGLDWSPDGKYLAFPDRKVPGSPTGIHLLSLNTLEKRQLISPPADSRGDSRPAFSPDSSALAFIRTESSSRSILISAIAGGEPKRVFSQRIGGMPGVAWAADGRSLICSAPAGQGAVNYNLWRIPADGGMPARLTSELGNDYSPSVSRHGNRLAFARASTDVNIWRLEVSEGVQRQDPPMMLISSTRQDGAPQYSPDGKKIAFQSDRLGSREIWICESDGSNPVQLTFSGGARAGSPRWSPDGRQIAFNIVAADTDRHTGVYVVPAKGGAPRELTSEVYDAAGPPSWSRNGEWIYFGSDRTGRIELWRVPSDGGQPLQVTRNGGSSAFESPDGRDLYYTKGDRAGLWSMPVKGGSESRILDWPDPAYWGFWEIGKDGIYFLDISARPYGALDFYGFATRHVKRIIVFDKGVDSWDGALAVSPDGRWILFARIDSENGDLVLMENFR